ncbi:MAG TPA: outer membrane beta-barrel protein [Chitinophagales bacterium]|nr:outer membrane beta-barrel protein [Chitinophagales bacterium]
MKKATHLFLLSFFVFHLSISLTNNLKGQELYVKGYIVTLQDNKVPGLIYIKNINYCPAQILFKTQPDEEPVAHTPQTIAGFEAYNRIYESAVVKRETSPTNINELENNPIHNYETDSVFLWQLFGGEKSLYVYIDQRKVSQFYIKTPQALQLLSYKAYFTDDKEAITMEENNAYKYQLKDYLIDCKNIDQLLVYTKYEFNNLYSLFTNYYKCTKQNPQHKAKLPPHPKQIGIFAGMAVTSLSFSKDDSYYLSTFGTLYNLAKADIKNSYQYTAGAFIELGLNRTRKNFSVYNELAVWNIKTTSYYKSSSYEQKASFNISTLRLCHLLRYRANFTRHSRMFVSAGFFNGFALNRQTEMTVGQYNSPFNTQTVALQYQQRYEFGYMAGLGFQFNKILLEGRYGGGTGIANPREYGERARYLSLQLGFRLF